MIKGKPVIGIVATSNYMLTNDTFQDTYRYGNNYAKKIVEMGGIPYFMPLVDEQVIEECLDICDGLLLPGGNRIRPFHFEILDFFYKTKKPILGICMGMQVLAISSVPKEKRILKAIDNGVDHHPVELLRENNTTLAHKIKIDKKTILYDILKQEEVMVNSVHRSTVTEVGEHFKISAFSEDGLIEGIEYAKDDQFILGVQFHPEILEQFNSIFERFILECKNKK